MKSASMIRYSMLLLTLMVAIMLYLDRVCLSIAGESVKNSLKMTDDEMAWLHSAFFWSYALFQLPAGWLGDRWGARNVLSILLICWSACTGLMGLANGFLVLFALRLGCGMFEAGAYPIASSIVRKWMPPASRGTGSSIVAVGGRIGGSLAPLMTVALMNFALSNGWFAEDQSGWRLPFLIYGAIGIGLAAIFWSWFRNSPSEHPAVNQAEQDLIENAGDRALTDVVNVKSPKQQLGWPPIGKMMTNSSMWLNCFVQFASNFCWVFLITQFPKYLIDRFQIPTESQAWMQSATLYGGIVGMLLGGWMVDRWVRRYGSRWGIAFSLSFSRVLIATAFLAAIPMQFAWGSTAAMVMVALATDLGIAAMWAYAQQSGGKHVGSVMGWANMWGNFGSAVSPIAFQWILSWYASRSDGWGAVFVMCGLLQLVAAVASLGVDPRQSFE